MEDLLKKISQYQLFNFLLSGALLAVLLDKTTSINIIYDNAIVAFFAFYFAGLVTSRVGSLVVEPILKKLKVIVFAPYPDYLEAVKVDAKIDKLSQENNTYRTLIATFLVFIVVYTLNTYAQDFTADKPAAVIYTSVTMLIVLFTLAYHKQTNYITQRIKKARNK